MAHRFIDLYICLGVVRHVETGLTIPRHIYILYIQSADKVFVKHPTYIHHMDVCSNHRTTEYIPSHIFHGLYFLQLYPYKIHQYTP